MTPPFLQRGRAVTTSAFRTQEASPAPTTGALADASEPAGSFSRTACPPDYVMYVNQHLLLMQPVDNAGMTLCAGLAVYAVVLRMPLHLCCREFCGI